MNIEEWTKEIGDWARANRLGVMPGLVVHLAQEVVELGIAWRIWFDANYETKTTDADKAVVANELADCAILIINVAYTMGIDLEQAIYDKHRINKKRLWDQPDTSGVVHHKESR